MKVDALTLALATMMHHQLRDDRAAVERCIEELRAAVGIEERLWGETGEVREPQR